MKEALHYRRPENKIICGLCPHECHLNDNQTGICMVRTRKGDKLYTDNYGLLSALNFDPIEKKPLYHFHPGEIILSLGSVGCNLACQCCQNWEIARSPVSNYSGFQKYSVDQIVHMAHSRKNNTGIAFTYNEPTVWYEYMLDIARESKNRGLSNVVVSNGYIMPGPLTNLLAFIDAFNIDLKGFTEDFYQKVTRSKLEPVKTTLKKIASSGKHLEITNLIIPGLNDNKNTFKEMIHWIKNELGQDTILHLSRYYPSYKMDIESTPPETMLDLFHIARSELKYVYLGNINLKGSQDTRCPVCSSIVIIRVGYHIDNSGIDSEGNCIHCKTEIVKT